MFRIRARRTRQAVPKIQEGAAVTEIYTRYFCSIGLENESGQASGSPEWKAAFNIKFGKPEYRRAAWQSVRAAVKGKLPAEIFKTLDGYYTDGPALHFTQGFSLEDRERMLKLVGG
ncbi:MAG: hypothetical protein A2052_03725 [Deltaproteobacteria bacterium GWA2_54_12]|nr:MAG: hypothetical protein A2052_03725 [Deltaproteobacteria bacterium GWA2_54_12]